MNWEKITNQIRVLFGIDVRSLALFRIGLGSLLLADLIFRVQDLRAFIPILGFCLEGSSSKNFPSQGTFRFTILMEPLFLPVCFFVYVFLWNLRTTNFSTFSKFFPKKINGIAQIFRIDQKWNMFSPYPLVNDGWFVIPGNLKDGSQVDLMKGGREISWEKPKSFDETFKNERWRKYLMNLYKKDYSEHRPYYAQYLCREWNRNHRGAEELERLEIFFMLERTLKDGVAPIQKVSLLEYECGKGNKKEGLIKDESNKDE